MREILVQFEYEGKTYEGELTEVGGAGGAMWHLMINKKYAGCLMKVEDNPTPHLPRELSTVKYKWQFTSQKGENQLLTELLSKIIEENL